MRSKISEFILDKVKSKLNAELVFKEPDLCFKSLKLRLHADEIIIKQNQEAIIYLKNFHLTYPLKNIFRSKQIISAISADKVFVKAVKQDDTWNLESILKPSDKEAEFIFKSLRLHDTDLEIYSNNFFEKENVYIDIHKVKTQKLYNVEFYNNRQLKDFDGSQQKPTELENQFYISGDYDLENNDVVYRFVKNLNVTFIDMQPNLINLISRAFTDRKSRFISLFNKYSDEHTSLSLFLKESGAEDESYLVNMQLNDFAKQDYHLDSHFDLGQNIEIEDFDMKTFAGTLSAKGFINDSITKDPSFDLDISLTNFDFYAFRNNFVELQNLIPTRVVQMLKTFHKDRLFNPQAKLSGSFHEPELAVTMPVGQQTAEKKNFEFDLLMAEDRYQIKKFLLPFEFAEMVITGFVDHAGAYDLKVITEDFPLRSLKTLAMAALSEEEAKELRDFRFQGYLKSDLDIKKSAKAELPYLYGDIILAKTSILEPNIPILMQNISAKLNAEKDTIKVSDFVGSLYENKVDLNGFYNIHSNDHKINISSKKFNLAKIEGYQIKKYIPAISNFSNISGEIKNLEINSTGAVAKLALSGDLSEVAFDYSANNNIVNFKNLNSGFAFVDESIEIKALETYVNDNSVLNLDGVYDLNGKKTKLKAHAKKLPFAALSIIDRESFPIHPKSGLISFDLEQNVKSIKAKGDFSDLAFSINSEKMPENFRSTNGEFAIDENLYLNGLTTVYGNSVIKANKFQIDNFLTDDKHYDIDIESDLKIAEFKSFIPKGIAALLHLDGYLPLNIRAKGDQQKFYLDLDGNFNEVKKLGFAEWFNFDTNIQADFKSSFYFTPKLILSKDTVVNFKNENSQTSLAADFEVHDWKEGKELRYSIDAYTPMDKNGEFIPVDMDLIEPHIVSIEALNLDAGTGTVQCRTDGAIDARHTFCDIELLDKAVAQNFGVGDLTSDRSSVYLISVKDKPVYVKVNLFEGLWNILDYKRVKFDMEITEDLMKIDRLRAKLKQGFIRSNIAFDFNTLDSIFKIKGNNVSAHKAAESFFALGHEVPQGTISGQFEGKTKGLLPDDMFFNLEAEASMLVRDGKLSSLKTMQKLLSAVNTLKNFDFNNVFQTVITYKGGLFNDLVSQLKFTKGKIDTEKLILHSDQIELHIEGFVDYAQDYLMIRGLGSVPERSKSFLQLLGVKDFNLGNLLSIINLRNPGSKDRDYFAFMMKGPASNMDEATQSLRQNFTWLRSYGPSE